MRSRGIYPGRVVASLALLVVCLPACNKTPPAVAPPVVMGDEASTTKAEDVMFGVSTQVSSFGKLVAGCENASDVEAVEDELNEVISQLELVVDQSQVTIEPRQADIQDLVQQRASLQLMIDQFNDQVDLVADNAAIWKVLRPHYERFDAVLKMVNLIPVDSITREDFDFPSP